MATANTKTTDENKKKLYSGQVINQLTINSESTKGSSIPLRARMVTINDTVPKIYKYQQGSIGIDSEIAVQMMLQTSVRETVINSLRSIEFVEQVLLTTTGARGGKFKTDIDLVTMDSLRKAITDALSKVGGRVNQHVITVLSGFFLELLSRLNIVAKSGTLELFDLKTNFFVSTKDIIDEMKKIKLSYAVSLFDMTKIEAKREIGVAAVVSEVTSQANAMEIALLTLNNATAHFDTVLTLIRTYILRDFASISDDEMTFFDNDRFLELSANITLIKLAMRVKSARPKASYNFWIQSLEHVDSAIKSAPMFKTIDIGALKEYYTFTGVNDQDGLKKGFVLTRNIHESKPFQMFYKLNDTLSQQDGFWRLSEDHTTSRQLSDAFAQASKLKMNDVHDFAANMLSKFIKAEDELFSAVLDIDEEELVLIAASFGAKLEVMNIVSDGPYINPSIIFRLDTTGSKIRTPINTFLGTLKTSDPLVALLIEGSDHVGSVSFTDGSTTVEEPKNKLFIKLSNFLDNRISSDVQIRISTTIGHVTMKTNMETLLATQELDRLVAVKPHTGEIIYNALFEVFDDLEKFERFVAPEFNSSIYKTSAPIAFVSKFKDVLISRDLQDVVYVAKGIIWDHLVEGGQTRSTGQSILSDRRVEVELQIMLGIELLDKLGFLTNEELKAKAINIFKEAQLYDLISI